MQIKDTHDLIRQIIHTIGDDPTREGVAETPDRVVRSWSQLFGGYKQDPREVLGKTFAKDGYREMVLVKDIEMYSTCEHHMLPFFGKAHIAYIPSERVVGLSKVARLVECFSRRLQIQERLTEQIASAMEDVLEPVGVAVVINAVHFCMVARGINKQNAHMTTSSLRGVFRTQAETRNEFFSLVNAKK